MELADYASIGAIVVCTMLMAVAVAVEYALNNLSRVRLRAMEGKNPRAVALLTEAMDSPRSYITAAELAESVFSMINAILIARLCIRLNDPVGSWLAAIVAVLVVLLLGVVLPRTRAGYDPEHTALTYLPWLGLLRTITRPLMIPLLGLSRIILRAFGRRPVPTPSDLQEGVLDFISTVEEAAERPQEEEMLESLVEFRTTLVREVMVPRPDIVALPQGASLQQILDTALESGYSRLPVYSETVDAITGVIYVKDLLRLLRDYTVETAPTFDLLQLAREPYFVPEAKKVDELLRELRSRRTQMAIVVDEYGGTAGLVTIEDLLEEIVGEIQDEYDTEEPEVVADEVGGYFIDAGTSIDEVNDLFSVNWDDEDYETLGGFVYEQLGRIPVIGDEIERNGVRIQVRSTEGRRLRKLYAIRYANESDNEPDDGRNRNGRGNTRPHNTYGLGNDGTNE